MITYKFIANDKAQDIKAMSLKKAKEVTVEWVSKKGNVSFYSYKLPYKTRKERKGKL
jgi:hypothetical protein